MAKNTCQYKDLILGLREESKNTNKKLEELKDYTSIMDKKIDNYYYWLHRWTELAGPRVMCEVEKPIAFWNNQKNTINAFLIKDDNNYKFNQPIGLYIKGNNHEAFNNTTDEILTSEYANLAYTKYIQGKNKRLYHSTQITPSILRSSIYNGIEGNLTFQYNLPKDELRIIHYPHEITNDLIREILELEYPIDSFPDYIKEIIEKGNNKDISIITDLKTATDITLKAEEDREKVYLKTKN